MRALNLGSGQRRFDTAKGWVNVDVTIRPDQRPDICGDGGKLPFPDDTFDCVVLHHVLEHFGCGEADKLIREAHRCLRTGGSLFVFVPDLRALAVRWITGKLDTDTYIVDIYGAYNGHEEDRHKWGYDRDSLCGWFARRGEWNMVSVCTPMGIEGADIAWDWWILAVECVK